MFSSTKVDSTDAGAITVPKRIQTQFSSTGVRISCVHLHNMSSEYSSSSHRRRISNSWLSPRNSLMKAREIHKTKREEYKGHWVSKCCSYSQLPRDFAPPRIISVAGVAVSFQLAAWKHDTRVKATHLRRPIRSKIPNVSHAILCPAPNMLYTSRMRHCCVCISAQQRVASLSRSHAERPCTQGSCMVHRLTAMPRAVGSVSRPLKKYAPTTLYV